MRLSGLLKHASNGAGNGFVPEDSSVDPEITGIYYRAQAVRPGGLFVAIKGSAADGHDYISTALDRGASAIVVQHNSTAAAQMIRVPDTRKALGLLAAAFYGHPADRLCMIGVTGTNGKTTTAYLIESILQAAGYRVGVIGTVNYRYAGLVFSNPVTTPESADLQRILADMRNAGMTHVVMEVSSHGIQMERIIGCRYDIAVFTNLSQDHLDFHLTMDAYWSCKQRLFTEFLKPADGRARYRAVVNGSNPRGVSLAAKLGQKAITVGNSADHAVNAHSVDCSLSGISARIRLPAGVFQMRSLLVGMHNLENILCAAGVASSLGIAPESVRDGIEALQTVPGRLEPIENERMRFVYVDYAHTPDALENALAALKEISTRRIICVFGCGGDRDRGKRPLMGGIAARNSHLAIVTSDNPRTENPMDIIHQIVEGMQDSPGRAYTPEMLANGLDRPGFVVEPDRAKAIRLGIAVSQPEDTILIAGKGHETYQIIGDRKTAFDDREMARKALGTER